MTELEYTEIDGLLYPNLTLGDEALYDDLGKYGNLRLRYLHKQKPRLYSELLFSGKLAQHCSEMEQNAFDLAERIRSKYLRANPPPAEGIERIQAFTQAQMIAEEIVLHDMVCN